MFRNILSIAAALFFPFGMAYGEEIYRCPGPNGTSVYQPKALVTTGSGTM